MTRLYKRLRAFWRRRELDHDLENELRFHLDMRTAEIGNQAEAERLFGNTTKLKELCRDLWSFGKLESCWQDIRYAVRMLARTPAFTLVAVVALALGIGADTAVFSIANGAFSWNLGLDHVKRVVLVSMVDRSRREGFLVAYPDFQYLRGQTKSLAGLAAYQFASANLSDNKTLPERYYCVQMSANGFFVSEQKPAIGRAFRPADERPGAPPVAVLTYHVWEDRYGKDPLILGKTIRVNDIARTVIGVMPPGKRFPEDTDLWTPLVPDARLEQRDNRSLMLFGRLADGVSLAAVRSELHNLTDRIAKQHPDTNHDLTADVQPIVHITGAYSMRPLFIALWAAVGFVVLIACADVANMLLARGTGRMREISIRLALGAGRVRIIRQLLIESILLAIAGGFLAWLVALAWLHGFDVATGGIVKPPWLNLSFDQRAFAYLAVVTLGAGILFGFVPSIRLAKIDVHSAIKDGGQGVTGERRVLALSNVLVVFEMALCIVLLAGAGLMIRSTVNLYGAPIGVNTADVLTMRVNLPEARYQSTEKQIGFHRALKARIDSLPGVADSALSSNLPFGGWLVLSYQLEGKTSEPDHLPQVGAIVASSHYFRVMRVAPKRGRTFSESDGIAGSPVVLVNETFARTFWAGQNVIGKRLRLFKDHALQPWLTVVGVIPDILQNFRRPLDHDALIYLPYTEEPQREMFVLTKTRVPPVSLVDGFRRAVQNIDSNLPIYDIRTLDSRLDQNRLSVTILGGMFSVFAGVALLLASIGLYAVIAHAVSQRTQEIGLRVAIGGTPRDILRLVYSQGMRPLIVGLLFGLPAAYGVTHVLGRALIGVSPGDPLTFLVSVLVLIGAGLLGCLIPARRALEVDPIVALRYE